MLKKTSDTWTHSTSIPEIDAKQNINKLLSNTPWERTNLLLADPIRNNDFAC